uniref:Alpha-carbonic anhydrase domain-containing protein n=1 Tax=Romanomermis culicivorax TaxID=13658 RepID=A0A915JP45_ROMCU
MILFAFFILLLYGFVSGDEDWSYFSLKRHGNFTYFECSSEDRPPSNINTRKVIIDSSLPPLQFLNYNLTYKDLKVINDGRSVKLETSRTASGDVPMITSSLFNWQYYRLLQCHFHWSHDSNETDSGAEHLINGIQFPMEAHCVHVKANLTSEEEKIGGNLIILAIFFDLDDQDDNNPILDDLIRDLETVQNNKSIATVSSWRWDKLLPDFVDDFFWYNGSLKTPTCSEIVQWILFTQPVVMSKKQLTQFRQMMQKIPIQNVAHTLDPTAVTFASNRTLKPIFGRKIFWRRVDNSARTKILPRLLFIFVFSTFFYLYF